MIACVWERERDHSGEVGGGCRGREAGALPRGSVCKPLSTPQSCFHKEIYKTGLWCASLPCIISVRVCKKCTLQTFPVLIIFFYLYAEFYIDRSLPGPDSNGPARVTYPVTPPPLSLWWQGARVCRCEDSHVHGMLLALGIIYKAWLLCGTLSLCLLPLQPMTLPALPSCPSPHRELSLGFCLSPLWPLFSREPAFYFYISCC